MSRKSRRTRARNLNAQQAPRDEAGAHASREERGRAKPDPTPEERPQPHQQQTFGQWLWSWVKTIVIAFAIWFVLQALVIKSFRIDSGSMEPTLFEGDWLFINRVIYGAPVPLLGFRTPKVRDPERGELIVLRGVEEPVLSIVKRVIALGGDTVEFRSDSLFRNGAYVPEPYVQHVDPTMPTDPVTVEQMRAWQLPYLLDTVEKATYRPTLRTWGPVVLPPEHLLTMGDNRDASYDGRHWGFLPRPNVMGRPLIIYYSFDPNHWRPLPFVTAIRWGRMFRAPW
jgi:signal peptidase I